MTIKVENSTTLPRKLWETFLLAGLRQLGNTPAELVKATLRDDELRVTWTTAVKDGTGENGGMA